MPNVRHMRRQLLALVALVAAFVVPVSAAQAKDFFLPLPPHKYPAFYVPPSPLPPGKPGDIIRVRPISFKQSLQKPPAGTTGYLVMYHSTSATGEDIAVTGHVLIPDAKIYPPKQGVENRPIIGYGNEAEGLGDACAQSEILQWGQSGELNLFGPMLRRGYAVAATDYEGLGTPSVHTFGVTQSAARNVLDMVRAARNIVDSGLPKNGPVALFGYSQGGAAVAGAEEIQPAYAPDVKLSAVAAGGAPIDPIAFSKRNSGQLFSSVDFAAAAGYDAAYPELDLKSFLNERGEVALEHTYTSCIEAIFSLPFRRISSYLKPGMSPLTDPRWAARFKENTIGQNPPLGVPTLYFHAIWDQAAPYRMATQLRRQWCAGGTQLDFQGLPLVEHVSGGPLYMPIAAAWVAARLEGKPDLGNCGHYGPASGPVLTAPAVPAFTTPTI